MKKWIIGTVVLVFTVSCQDNKGEIKGEIIPTDESIDFDSLPEGKWNGEYLKIDIEEKKPKKKSSGSEIYNMGVVDIQLGEKKLDFQLFERRKNALTFTQNSINTFISNPFEEQIQIQFKKDKIITHYKGKYVVDTTLSKNQSVKMWVKLKNEENYILDEGNIEIIDFNPRLGTIEATVDGLFINKKGEKIKGKGKIKMHFEEATMTIQ